jgi:hypothetical protein
MFRTEGLPLVGSSQLVFQYIRSYPQLPSPAIRRAVPQMQEINT